MSHAKTGLMQNAKRYQMRNTPTCRMLLGFERTAAIKRQRGDLRGKTVQKVWTTLTAKFVVTGKST